MLPPLAPETKLRKSQLFLTAAAAGSPHSEGPQHNRKILESWPVAHLLKSISDAAEVQHNERNIRIPALSEKRLARVLPSIYGSMGLSEGYTLQLFKLELRGPKKMTWILKIFTIRPRKAYA